MTGDRDDPLPFALGADRWNSVPTVYSVLLVAHNVTTVTRLLDIIPVFDSDPRIQLLFTWVDSDPCRADVEEVIRALGIVTLSWETALANEFQLAISASHHGGIGKLTAPMLILSHGIGYTKYSPNSEQRTANSEQRTANSEQRTANSEQRDIFGLSPEWVLHEGKPAAEALVLSHADQLRQLSDLAPAAVPAAYIAGDPCFDRILASLPFRARYRNALGTGARRLVVVSSTWSRHSTIGTRFDLVRELLAELPRDRYAVALILHPNISHRHGPGQLRHWFADCLRSGLIVLPEFDGWRCGLIAADIVIGDNGSVTGYGAAIGRPTLLAAFPEHVPPGTPISELGRLAPRLPPHGPYLPALEAAMATEPTAFEPIAALVTSEPGRSLALLRRRCYEILGTDEPAVDVPEFVLPAPELEVRPAQFADLVTTTGQPLDTISLQRRPAEVRRIQAGLSPEPKDAVHLSCSVDYPIRSLLRRADVIVTPRSDCPADPLRALADILDRFPACSMAAVVDSTECLALLRSGEQLRLRSAGLPPEALPSALWAWLDAAPAGLPEAISVRLGPIRAEITVESADPDH